MHWNSLADFLAMGDHGLYVWGSVVVTALLMIAEPILVVRGRRKLLLRLMRQYRAEGVDRRDHRQPTTRRSPA
ncbi:MAG TPA: heme exporter protein CcmD [Accumulibacter sp.]|jgi:heme exporter protein D|nr:heme exporter protein CcmD [Accumulibacter sp.]HQC79305.1 heme exporter protein CcmD [Accumulibacter sp.]